MRRRTFAFATSLALIAALSGDGVARDREQRVKGSILLPAVPITSQPDIENCAPGHHRRLMDRSDGATDAYNGVLGWHFNVSPRTYGEGFDLKATGGEGVDLDIFFYVATGGGNPSGFDTGRGSGERGVVPQGSRFAIVCLNKGTAATFEYRAGPSVQPPDLVEEQTRSAAFPDNIRLLAHGLTTRTLQSLAFQGRTVVAGADGQGGGFHLFRILDQAPYIRQVSSYSCPGGVLGDVSIWGDYVFQSIEDWYPYINASLNDINQYRSKTCNNTDRSKGQYGIRVIDISEPEHPRQVAFLRTPCGSHTHTLVPADGELYIYSPVPCNEDVPPRLPGIPESPVKAFSNQIHVMRFDPIHPGRPEVWTPSISPQLGCHDITVHVHRSLAACTQYFNRAWNSSLLDISDPANPRVLSHLDAPATAQWMTFSSFTGDGKYLVTADTGVPFDETVFRPTARCTGTDDPTGRLYIYDVSNAYEPELVNSLSPSRSGPSSSLDCGPMEVGMVPLKNPKRYVATVAWLNGGLSVIDLSDPTEPVEISYWQVGPKSAMKAAHWYNGRIYATEGWTWDGLRVFEVDGLGLEAVHRYDDRLNPQTQVKEFR